MVTTYRRQGPSTPLIIIVAITFVLACFLIYTVGISSVEEIANQPTPTNSPTATDIPAFALAPSPTPVPACEIFSINVDTAYMRSCPDLTCDVRERIYLGQEVCAYGRAVDGDFLNSEEWFIIDLNPRGAFRDIVYMHNSVLRPVNPTPRPSQTFTPLPTITLTPTLPLMTDTPTPLPTIPPFPSNTPDGTLTPLPNIPLPGVVPTLPRQEF